MGSLPGRWSGATMRGDRGAYHVGAPIGQCGVADAYEAADQQGRAVALAVRDAGATAIAPERRRRAVELERRLGDHPFLVRVVDAGRDADAGVDFVVLQKLPGRTLAAVLPPGGLDRELALMIVRQVAEGVAMLHAQGVVHHDLHAGSVMVEMLRAPRDTVPTRARAYVVDLELARALDEDAAARDAGGPARDVWALGVLAFQTLTGRRPVTPEQQARLDVGDRTGIVPQRLETTNRSLNAVVEKALAVDPVERWRTGREFAAALDRAYPEGALVVKEMMIAPAAPRPSGARQSGARPSAPIIPAWVGAPGAPSAAPGAGRGAFVGRPATRRATMSAGVLAALLIGSAALAMEVVRYRQEREVRDEELARRQEAMATLDSLAVRLRPNPADYRPESPVAALPSTRLPMASFAPRLSGPAAPGVARSLATVTQAQGALVPGTGMTDLGKAFETDNKVRINTIHTWTPAGPSAAPTPVVVPKIEAKVDHDGIRARAIPRDSSAPAPPTPAPVLKDQVEDLGTFARERTQVVGSCYAEVTEPNPKLTGMLAVKVLVRQTGDLDPLSASWSFDESGPAYAGSAELKQCALARIDRWNVGRSYPKDFEYTISFHLTPPRVDVRPAGADTSLRP